MWILPERYDRREKLFGISPYQPVTFALATDRKVTGFFCSDKPVQKPVKQKIYQNKNNFCVYKYSILLYLSRAKTVLS
jgi:hypothetical protein